MEKCREIVPGISLRVFRSEATASSTLVAERFEKRHDNVLRDIENLKKECPEEFWLLNFEERDYIDERGKTYPSYEMTRDGFSLLTMGFTGSKAVQWKTDFIKAFNAMEDELRRYQAAGLRLDSPILVDALFDGQVSVFTAKQIQDFTPEEQQQILEVPKREIARTIKNLKMLKTGGQAATASQTGNNEWYTPSEWIERARQAMGTLDVDPASSEVAQQTVQASEWYDQERDGLQQEWQGNVWLNPPYARGLIDAFIEKLAEQFQSGIAKQAIVLVDNRTDTRWFQVLCSIASAVAFTKGRVNFYNETVESSSPANGSVFVYLGPCVQAFKQAFDSNCLVLFTQEALLLQEISHGP